MKKLFGLMIVFSLIAVIFMFPVMAENQNSCGENLTWVLDDYGVLTISGTGDMFEFQYPSDVPWYNDQWLINKVVVESGVTSIGNYAFFWDTGVFYEKEDVLRSVIISNTVTQIGEQAFGNRVALTSITFEGNAPDGDISTILSGISSDPTVYYYEGTTGWDSLQNTTIKHEALPNPTQQTKYTVALSVSPLTATVGETISVTITAGKVFSASELTLTYDATALAFTKLPNPGNAVVKDKNGSLNLIDFGGEKTSYTIEFEAIQAGTAEIRLISAAFGESENAAVEDLTEVDISNAVVSVTVNEPDQTVVLPSDNSLSGADSVVYGKDYTFKITNYNQYYVYTITATMDGESVEAVHNGDGNYTIADVRGKLVISLQSTPKTYTVTITKASDMDQLPDSANVVYDTDYTLELPMKEHYSAQVKVLYGTTQGAAPYEIKDGKLVIDGTAITDHLTITVSWQQVDATVTVAGSGAGDVQNNSAWAVYGEDYLLTVNPDSKYVYAVTAAVNEGTPITLTANENHTYTLSKDAIPQGAIIVLTVEKTLAVNISVNHYLTLGGGQNLYLILNTVDKTNGMIYRYGDTAMFWSDAYGAYCTLILASSAPKIDDILLTLDDGITVAVDDSMDVNMSGKLDANDAQFVYNMYNNMYSGITTDVTIEKYLRADVNYDRKITVDDAAAVVNKIMNPNT